MSTEERLNKVFVNAKEVPFDDSDKFILFSDCHRGDNSWADEFTHNHNLFLHALQHYYSKEFTYIEVGDGDELWENPFEDIRQAHTDIFLQMKKFYDDNRLYLIWGNHDILRQEEKTVKKTLFQYYDRYTKKYKSLFDGLKVHEGLILTHSGKNNKILLVHGHQGDLWNDRLWQWNKHYHRMVWRYVQYFGIRNPASPAKYFRRVKKIEKNLKQWAKANEQILIAGHTHSCVFPSLADPPYFNIGSCVSPHRITGIEIVNSQISLIEWRIKVKEKDGTLYGGTLYADRDVISQSYPVGTPFEVNYPTDSCKIS